MGIIFGKPPLLPPPPPSVNSLLCSGPFCKNRVDYNRNQNLVISLYCSRECEEWDERLKKKPMQEATQEYEKFDWGFARMYTGGL